jgi:hypothetical protein
MESGPRSGRDGAFSFLDHRTKENGDMEADEHESLDPVGRHFPELDEAARRRAADRMAEGAEPHAALARESVILQMVRAYN